MTLDVGRLKHRVEWQSVTSTTNANGQIIPVIKSNGTFWASVRPMKADETVESKGEELRSEVLYDIDMRFIGNVLPSDRLIFRGKTLEILGVVNVDEQNWELQITAKEVRVG